jgi:hypothetical protein
MPSSFLCAFTLGSDVINYLWIYYNFYMGFLFCKIMFKLIVSMVFVGIVASYSYKNRDSQVYWLPIHSHIPTYCYQHKNGDSQVAFWVFWTVNLHCSAYYKSLLTPIVIFFHFDHQTFFWFHPFVFVLRFICFFSCLFLFFTFSWDTKILKVHLMRHGFNL